jgi:hypothetical protein
MLDSHVHLGLEPPSQGGSFRGWRPQGINQADMHGEEGLPQVISAGVARIGGVAVAAEIRNAEHD